MRVTDWLEIVGIVAAGLGIAVAAAALVGTLWLGVGAGMTVFGIWLVAASWVLVRLGGEQ